MSPDGEGRPATTGARFDPQTRLVFPNAASAIGAGHRKSAVRVAARFSTSAQKLFAAWLDPDQAGTWLFATALRPMTDVSIDARVGGVFRFAEVRDGAVAENCGTYIEIDPTRRLAFALRTSMLPDIETRVRIEITTAWRASGFTLTHEDVPDEHRRRIRARWVGILFGLGETLGVASNL